MELEFYKKINELQDSAVNAVGECGTICSATGTGKTFMAFKWLYKLLNEKKIKKKDTVWFLAEVTNRKDTLKEEAKKFKEIFKLDVMSDFNIKFHCYQGKPKGKPVAIIADEIHESLTPEYKSVYENNHKFILGLSATIPKNLKVYRDDEENKLTKGNLIKEIAPIKFTYSLDQGIKDKILSPFNTTIIHHTLDKSKKIIKDGTKTKSWKSTEEKYYSWRESIVNNPFRNKFYKRRKAEEMCKLLWNLPSKADVVKKLLKEIDGKTIIFGVQLDLLQQILPEDQIVAGGKGPIREVRNKNNKKVRKRKTKTEKENNKIIQNFNDGKINIIGSAKKLKQGITLNGVSNCIIVSYYSESWHMIQQLGRIVRFVPGKVAQLFIIETLNTYETKWIKGFTEIKDENGEIESTIKLNVERFILSKNIKDGFKSYSRTKTKQTS